MQQKTNKTARAIKVTACLLVLAVIPTMYTLAGPRGLSDPTGAPIDGGISLLVAAGIGYGAKKMKEARKKVEKRVEK